MLHSGLKNTLFISFGVLLLISCSSSPQKTFEREAKELNRLYPMMVNFEARIDSVAYAADTNVFRYCYTLLENSDNPNITGQEREELRANLLSEIKRTQGMDIYRKHKVTIEYIYFSGSTGNELYRITITPDMYK